MPSSRRSIMVLVLAVVLACGSNPWHAAGATVSVRPTLSELAAAGDLTYHALCQRARMIAAGTVTHLHSYWGPNGRGVNTIYTTVTLSSAELLKGDAGSSVTFTIPGGKVGEDILVVSDTPDLCLGDEVLVFLEIHDRGMLYPLGSVVLVGDQLGVQYFGSATAVNSAAREALLDHIRGIVSGQPVAPIQVCPGREERSVFERPINVAGKILATPAITSISSPRLMWDPNHPYHPLTDTLVISGSNLGSGASTDSVKYPISTTANYWTIAGTNSDIISWTSTQIRMKVTHLLAKSGNVSVRTLSGGWSSAISCNFPFVTRYPTDCDTFCYWSNQKASNGITYYFNYSTYAGTGPTGTVSDIMWTGENWHHADTAGVDKGFKTWQDVTYSNLVFTDGGNSGQIDPPDPQYGNTNGYNTVSWDSLGSGDGAKTWWHGKADTICECDIVFNYMLKNDQQQVDTLFWSTKDNPDSDSVHWWRSQPKDVWDVMTHEVGHCLGLRDMKGTPDIYKTMYYTSGRRDTLRRTLTTDDAAAPKWLYPSGSPKEGHVVSQTNALIPGQLSLERIWPNPFNPLTCIRFRVSEPGQVTVKVYNVSGQVVRTLMSQEDRGSGEWQVSWDGKDDSGASLATGIYLCRVTEGAKTMTAKMSLVR